MISSDRRVVITGLGVMSPIGNSVKDFWEALERGESGARVLDEPLLNDFHVKIGATVQIPENAKELFKNKKMMKRLDRYIILGCLAGIEAVRDSGLNIEEDPGQVGCIIASGEGGLDTHWEQIGRIISKGMNSVSPFYITNVIPNSASAFLSMECNIQGPTFSVNSACASSNHAMGLAVSLIKMGMAEAIFAGGAETVLTIPSLAAFGIIGALSTRNDDPAAASRPFDRDRDGFVMGEGAGVLCLEELEHAKKRGAKIYAEVTGFGFTTDAYDLVAPHPEGKGVAQAILNSIKMAGISADKIGLINCHGTSTPVGDRAESLAINQAFGADLASKIPAHSTKSMIGHLIGATSAVEAVAAIMAFEKGIIHRTLNHQNKDPEINLNVVAETREAKNVDHILSNAFGFGGHNACVILSRYKG